MNESRLTYLFKVYFNKTATPEERNELMELLAQSENDDLVKELLAETWQQHTIGKQILHVSHGDEILSNILQKETANKSVSPGRLHRKTFVFLRISTVAAVLMFAFAGIYFLTKRKSLVQQTAQVKMPFKPAQDTIVPGGNKALLTLSDGSDIVLDSNHVGTLKNQGNAKVTNLNTATVAYNVTSENNREIVYNTLSTSNGGQYQLILSDGTRVWLNASSSIHFPTIFKGKERNVTVTGEVYFEVAANAAMPFLVNVSDVEVRVLGTHFNIMAYSDENSVNTTLLEGSVKISRKGLHRMLVPGQESRINKAGNFKVVEADMEEVMAWKNGWFQFNSSDIQKVMRQISRWYNIEVVYAGKIPAGHFSGMVSRGNNILQVLKIMEAGDVGFKIEGRKVIVYPGNLN